MTGEEAAVAVAEALDALGIPYMLSGSFAANHYGIPRSTQDADFVIELGTRRIGDLVAQLGPAFQLDPRIAFETVTSTTRYALGLRDSPFRIELFLLSQDARDQERFGRRRSVPALGRLGMQRVAPHRRGCYRDEAALVRPCHRGKDRDDLRDVIAVQGQHIDWLYVHRWCDEHGTRRLLDEIRKEAEPGMENEARRSFPCGARAR